VSALAADAQDRDSGQEKNMRPWIILDKNTSIKYVLAVL
jgi:hypothetical protein